MNTSTLRSTLCSLILCIVGCQSQVATLIEAERLIQHMELEVAISPRSPLLFVV